MTKKKKKTPNTKMVKQWAPEIKNVVINGTKSYRPVLTKKQYKVLTNWMTGRLTQKEMGKKLGVCQTTIHKSLFGNKDYVNNKLKSGN